MFNNLMQYLLSLVSIWLYSCRSPTAVRDEISLHFSSLASIICIWKISEIIRDY
jgi:hypothetical protein